MHGQPTIKIFYQGLSLGIFHSINLRVFQLLVQANKKILVVQFIEFVTYFKQTRPEYKFIPADNSTV